MNFTAWHDAIRFANWMNNGQGNSSTETGAYTLGPLGPNGIPVTPPLTHNSGAKVWLPTENEWYKAAYHDPRTTAQGGPPSDSHYWLYPTGSNTVPTASGPTSLANHANYNNVVGNLTDVGAYTGTTSPYGAFDMAGNVNQWTEAIVAAGPGETERRRRVRGGSYGDNPVVSQSSPALVSFPQSQVLPNGGFRLASAPEPSSFVLAALGLISLVVWRRRKR